MELTINISEEDVKAVRETQMVDDEITATLKGRIYRAICEAYHKKES